MKTTKTLTGILFFVILLSFNSFAQHTIKGKVVDAATGEAMAFVNIIINHSKKGGSTDIDGKFVLTSTTPIHHLSLSFVGYKPMVTDNLKNAEFILLKMHRQEVEISGVTILPGINPAHRIIQNAVENRKKNDYENLPGFQYTAYEKMIFTINADSLLQKDTMLLDTNERKIRRFLDKRHFFMIENVIDRTFKAPASNSEKVTATRVSGFRDPIFVFLLTQLQTTSFYKEIIKIGDKNYLNPISEGPLERHFFQIEDTLYGGQKDSIFVISFRPWAGRNFDGLKGVIQISTDGWGIKNVIAEPDREAGGLSIKIQQLYHKTDSTGWFPLQLNTDILFKQASIQASKGGKSYKIVANGKTYIRDVKMLNNLRSRQFGHIAVDVDPHAAGRNENFWNTYRIDSLSLRELETYHFMDSLGKKQNFEKIAGTIETLMKSRIPWGVIDIDLNRLLRYNGHEGFYLGLGLETNDKISRTFRSGGYWGYGFGDKTAKYGLFTKVNINRARDISLKYDYHFDVFESGATHWFDDNRAFFSPESIRDLYVNRMDVERLHRLKLSFRILDYAMMHVSIQSKHKDPSYAYLFNSSNQSGDDIFDLTEISAGFRYAFREKFVQTTRGKMSLGTDYPILYLRYRHGLENFLDGEYAYDKIDFTLTHSIYWKMVGKTNIRIDAGIADGEAPLSELFNSRAAFAPFSLHAAGSFTTMRMNEFYTDQYVALFLSHNFGKLLYRTKKFEPEFELTTNCLIGKMSDTERHLLTSFSIPTKGYFESGFNIHNLLDFGIYNLGIGMAYRYGPYQLSKTIDNFTFNISLRFVGTN